MQSEKAIISAEDYGSNKKLTDGQFTMNKLPNFQFKSNADGDRSRRELLENSKLSRLPERRAFTLPDFSAKSPVVVCVGCGAATDYADAIQKAFSGCRKCVGIYGRLDAAHADNADRDKREKLTRFALEVKR